MPQTKFRTSPKGVSGNLEEVWPVFDACLRVGKLERAREFIERLSTGLHGTATPQQMIALHDRYLRACVHDLLVFPNKERADDLHTWYEMLIRNRDLPVTATTIACMSKIALLSSITGLTLESRITRYMDNVHPDIRVEALSIADVLTDEDVARITQTAPATYDMTSGISEEEVRAAAQGDTFQVGSNTPQVKPTTQRGSGLESLRKALSIFNEIPDGQDFSSVSPQALREIQSRLERDALECAIETWREIHSNNVKRGFINPSMVFGNTLYLWHLGMHDRLKTEWAEIDRVEKEGPRSKLDHDRCLYGPLLQLSSPERVAAATIIGALNICSQLGIEKGAALSVLLRYLGNIIEEDIRCQQERRSKRQEQRTLPDILRVNRRRHRAARIAAEAAAENSSFRSQPVEGGSSTQSQSDTGPAVTSLPDENPTALTPWPEHIRTKLASMLLHNLIETARVKVVKEHPDTKEFISQEQPAFSQAYALKKGRKVGIVLTNPQLVTMIMKEPRPELLVRHLPMIVPPDPWTKFDEGGYIDTPTRAIRFKPGEVDQRIYAEAAIARGDLDILFKGLDILGRTPWKINQQVLNVMVSAWNTGEAIANIPPLNPKIEIPKEPQPSVDPTERIAWFRAVRKAENEKSGLRSNRCFINYQLEIARAFRKHVMYFPHNMDFRGRAYPIPPLLNHMGADHARGLMMFGVGKPLGKTGLMWLRVHLSNLYGFDKASLEEREQFAIKNWEKIKDSAEKPLDGNRWWLEAEDPWQTLATCFEIKAALDSPHPEEYVSYLPVHQDGTCNGLQHYAALGGDIIGAQQVNLEPGERPADVYMAVAKLVTKRIQKDLRKKPGAPTSDHEMAVWLHDKISRKVVKQTVMTNVYGVTYNGARSQVMKQLDDLYPTLETESQIAIPYHAGYIARNIFAALGSMFQGAHDIQYWLGESASRICRSLGSDQLQALAKVNVDEIGGSFSRQTIPEEVKQRLRNTIVWTTPLRLPVAQPYRTVERKKIATIMQSLEVGCGHRTNPVNRRKQLQGFPPNFIHSLDATHMLLSAIDCHKAGLTFAAVHDSFWTHACDIDKMSTILRNAFVRIHEEDVVARLKTEFDVRYADSIYLGHVSVNSPAYKKIADWRKLRKHTLLGEALLEHKRQQLLRSGDAAEVERAKTMVTPASIAEELGNPHEQTIEDSEFARLGDIESKTSALAAEHDTMQYSAASESELLDVAEEEREADSAKGKTDEGPITEDKVSGGVTVRDRDAKDEIKDGSDKGDAAGKKKPKDKKKYSAKMHFWLPLVFPPVPQKVYPNSPSPVSTPQTFLTIYALTGRVPSQPVNGQQVLLLMIARDLELFLHGHTPAHKGIIGVNRTFFFGRGGGGHL